MQNDIHTPDPYSWTGSRNINLLDPDPNDFIVSEICQSLSRRPRYGGFSDQPVSIGAHLLICDAIFRDIVYGGVSAMLAPRVRKLRRYVFIHDWAEAYLSDIQRPLKHTEGFSAYRELEEVYDRRMRERWVGDVFSDEVLLLKKVDNLALAAEVHVAMPAVVGQWTSLPEPTPVGLAKARELLTSPMPTPRAIQHRMEAIAEEIGIR